jgi:hypothetical protein
MIEVNMLRYHNTFTMKMTDQQLHMLKMKVELLDQQAKEKIGRSDYENILVKEAQKMVAA